MRSSTARFMLAVAAALTGLTACAADAPTVARTSALTDTRLAVSALNASYSSWSAALSAELAPPGAHPNFNTASLDGCPFISTDGKMFFMASNRPGGLGGIDIWVATRESVDDPWGEPVNVGAPVNSSSNDFCPTLARDGHTFYFVSNRPGGCGGDDIYVTRRRDDNGFDEPENLGCQVNSAGNEASPFPLPESSLGPVLYFSSNQVGGYAPDAPGATTGDADIYMSESHGGVFGPATLVPGVNSASDDGQPNLRRDGLEIFFFSTRPGTLGLADIYSATRANASDVWSTPVNLGANVNGVAAETRPSLSWDGTTLYFGSTRAGGEGSTDIYVTTRRALNGKSE
jgi:hypothetical protein